jgi:hypothetical protein
LRDSPIYFDREKTDSKCIGCQDLCKGERLDIKQINLISTFLIAPSYLSSSIDCLQSQNGGNQQMAKVEHYRQLVQDLLRTYTEIQSSNKDLETELIFDTDRDRYQIVHVGWSDERRIYGCSLHLAYS